ncbi:MAG: glycosyltransferase [Rubrivivax sp.]|nr:glycosyltransferase [Rubrivivax sp.]
MAMPAVSIVMPCYNARAHLASSVGSVLAQSFPDWELIAVDDGSVDDTLAWLQAQRDPRIHVFSQANRGVSAARNAGLEQARGEYIAFLDADDTWEPLFLAVMHAALAARPDAVLAYCGWQNLGLPGGRGQPFVPPDHETPAKEEALFASCRWPIHAALVRRQAVLGAGGFDTGLQNAEDYLLWLRVAIQAPIVRVPRVLACYHFHGGDQASSQVARAALQHLQAQWYHLRDRPRFATALGRRRVRALTLGTLLHRGYECYWRRDLRNARTIFRTVMRHGYGTVPDWVRMLPAWLPESLHRRLLSARDHG